MLAIRKIMLMQAMSLFVCGLPMLFYGDEVGYINNYTCRDDAGKSYDNRWMHRPLIDWNKIAKIEEAGTVKQQVFSGTQNGVSENHLINCLNYNAND